MILDSINNIEKYAALNPRFAAVVAFIKEHKLEELSLGRHEIQGDDVFVNIVDSPVKFRDETRLESHREMIDIQIPISGQEEHGYTPLDKLPEAGYDAKDDISFYPGEAQAYYTLLPGQFAIYFPQDGHAPAITNRVLRKAIFKVKK